MNLLRFSAISAALIALLAPSASIGQREETRTYGQTQVRKKPLVSLEEARKIALSNAKGEIVHETLEQLSDKGCYSFDIKDSSDVKEVLVDSMTGQVIIVEKSSGPTATSTHMRAPSLRPH